MFYFSEEGKKRASPGMLRRSKIFENIGEPLLWGLYDVSRQGVAKFVLKFGLELVDHLSPEDIDDFFLRKEDGTLAGGETKHFTLVIARVP